MNTQQTKLQLEKKRPLTAKIDLAQLKERILAPPSLPPPGSSIHDNISPVNNEPVKVTRDDISQLQIIGRLDRQAGGLFIVKLRKNLFIFDQYKCEEAFIYYQLKSAHELKRDVLNVPLAIDEVAVGGKDHYDILRNEQYNKILLLNGFEIRRNTSGVELIALSSEIPNLGMSDLVELLRIIKKVLNSNRVKSSSFMVRPPRVLQYFAEESARLAQRLSPAMTPTEAKEILAKLTTSPQYFGQCPHKQPIFTKL